ncbi:hypothetical protein MtrunA17_Chr8g0385251 [Medicago truncatula]|uniref:Uncharacterized protein n=1 Tax=Medicago truncatula TaxID=3880 RepID=A0A396GQ11_MEDTR|nr:hypothetical protein MtrunA17_Chr8g0385251 [Medicago truncatula]
MVQRPIYLVQRHNEEKKPNFMSSSSLRVTATAAAFQTQFLSLPNSGCLLYIII